MTSIQTLLIPIQTDYVTIKVKQEISQKIYEGYKPKRRKCKHGLWCDISKGDPVICQTPQETKGFIKNNGRKNNAQAPFGR